MTAFPVSAIPTIAIVGRPNVGKSALFNRLLGQRKALVEDLPGTTRDRLEGVIQWLGRPIRIVDTGGIAGPDESAYSPLIREQVRLAMDEADVVLFIVDAREGLTAADEAVAALLRAFPRPMLVVANKADNQERAQSAVEFYALGLGEPRPISVQHARGIDDVMDDAVALLPRAERPAEDSALRVALVGRPNVGKSMLLNRLVGEQRVIVSDVPGTTRDAVDVRVEVDGHPFVLVDTAGIRRRGHIEPGVERHSVMRSQTAIERCDVAVLLVDATEPFTAQDLHIAGAVADAGRGLVVAVNKWDIAPEDVTKIQAAKLARSRLRFAPWAPVEFISAKTGAGISALMERVRSAGEARTRRVPTAELNALVHRAVTERPPTIRSGKRFNVLYCTQAQESPPTFVFFVNDAASLHFSYRRYLENVLRRVYSFEGTAIQLTFRSREEARKSGHPATNEEVPV